MITKKQALDYHQEGRPGKIEVIATKSTISQLDLSLAYTPGVAEPCREIVKDPLKANLYTARGNLVAVITNGTAVLGLGDIGPLAGKPVMEGKAVLFKRFADIDVFDIELDTHDSEKLIQAVKLMEPTFGGINLEDIKAPECFEIERRLVEEMNIPVFHDDQHGTAIISAAALINAAELVGKKLENIKMVVSGAGAAASSCVKHYTNFGLKLENVLVVDSSGVIYKGREKGMNKYKDIFAVETEARTLEDAMKGADVFIGLSRGGLVSQAMIKSMANDPIVIAMANPDPEIMYDDAKAARSDILMATGRSDYPNQVNNVLGFPFIFRGALDVHATKINKEMKMAATIALANLAKEDVPDEVAQGYDIDRLEYGRDYIIPKPLDPRVLTHVASAVAQAAMDSGVAKTQIEDMEAYRDSLEARLGKSRELLRTIIHKAQRNPKRIVFPEGESSRVIRASQQIVAQNIAHPILLGKPKVIHKIAEELHVDLKGVDIINPMKDARLDKYMTEMYEKRQRKGMTRRRADVLMKRRNYFGSMMVNMGDADGMVSGIAQNYANVLRPALQVMGVKKGIHKVAGLYILVFKNKIKFLADVTVNIDPTVEDIAEIALLTAEEVRKFGVIPKIALLSFSNFGSARHPQSIKMEEATKIIKEKTPDLIVDGEMHADVAVSTSLLKDHYPFSLLQEEANTLIFPELNSANIAYKLLKSLGNATAIGPILMGFEKPVNLLQFAASSVDDIVNMAAITVIEAQTKENK
ncbi:MAG: NADP-dependent malic enzyme [Candidatus Marinimicrobia bacterium]|nr:NADP-dependent malic enzyme [Candidatus Neomarinimicrobiota bacterium]